MQASIEDITIDSKYRADGVKLRKQNTTITSGDMGDMVNIKITDANDYYSFGMNHIGRMKSMPGGYQNYKYNGKQIQKTGCMIMERKPLIHLKNNSAFYHIIC